MTTRPAPSGPCRCSHPHTDHAHGAVTKEPGRGPCTHPGCGCRYHRTPKDTR